MKQGSSRRSFLKKSVSVLAGFNLLRRPDWLRAAGRESGMKYRVLGKTGLKVSEIGFGGYPIEDPDVLHYAIDRGINYVDTSDDYRGGDSEQVIGRVMKTRRKDVVLATKWHPWAKTRKEEMLKVLDGSLQRLQTDHVDLLQVHQVGQASGGQGIERVDNPELHEAMAIAKQQGKARFFGVTGHDGDLMAIMNHVLDGGKFDTILCRYNHLAYPEEAALFERAKNLGIGVVCMKTLAGAKGMDLTAFKGPGVSYAQSALRWVLSNPHLSSAIISIVSREQVDEYLPASGTAFTAKDRAVLDEYARQNGSEVCRFCNRCESLCPYEVPVANALRADMYARDYGWKAEGAKLYASLPVSAAACEGCAAPCLKGCEFGVDIKRLLVRAHRNFVPLSGLRASGERGPHGVS